MHNFKNYMGTGTYLGGTIGAIGPGLGPISGLVQPTDPN